MSVKKKLTREEKDFRRLREAEIATHRYEMAKAVKLTVAKTDILVESGKKDSSERFKLPIQEINRDLLKNIGYLFFSIIVVMGLKLGLKL